MTSRLRSWKSVASPPTCRCSAVAENPWISTTAARGDAACHVRAAGRLLLIRRQGKLTFATMRDQSGSIQLFVSRGDIGDEAHDEFERLDLGDWVGVEGTVMTTRKGELSVKVRSFVLLAKALR